MLSEKRTCIKFYVTYLLTMSKNEKSSPLINVDDDTCFAYPSEPDCTTNHPSNNLSKDSTLDAKLIILLERETELKLQIDELVEEITNLEAITKNRNRSNGGNEEDNKETKKNVVKKEISEGKNSFRLRI